MDSTTIGFWLDRFEANSPQAIFDKWPETVSGTLIELYTSDFVFHELAKAFIYYEAHPEKKPKSLRHWTIALMNWFENSWKNKQYFFEQMRTKSA